MKTARLVSDRWMIKKNWRNYYKPLIVQIFIHDWPATNDQDDQQDMFWTLDDTLWSLIYWEINLEHFSGISPIFYINNLHTNIWPSCSFGYIDWSVFYPTSIDFSNIWCNLVKQKLIFSLEMCVILPRIVQVNLLN